MLLKFQQLARDLPSKAAKNFWVTQATRALSIESTRRRKSDSSRISREESRYWLSVKTLMMRAHSRLSLTIIRRKRASLLMVTDASISTLEFSRVLTLQRKVLTLRSANSRRMLLSALTRHNCASMCLHKTANLSKLKELILLSTECKSAEKRKRRKKNSLNEAPAKNRQDFSGHK